MQAGRRLRLEVLVQNGLFVALLVAAVGLVAYLAREYRVEKDLTLSTRNTISPAAAEVLLRLKGPVKVVSYASPQDARLGNLRRATREFLASYQRAKPDIELEFVDPRADPKRAAAAGIRVNGEMVVEYNERSAHLTELSETAFVNLIMRLARSGERLALALEGHGERRLTGIANQDMGEFGSQLQAKGFKVAPLNLALAQEVPANASVLVIASPQTDLLPAEVAKIRAYVARGGNLLWLVDAEPLRGLQPVAEALGLVLSPGVVIDPEAAGVSRSPAMAVGAGYGRHPVTSGFRLQTLFPFARQIGTIESAGWRATPLVDVAPRGWVETGRLDANIAFDKGRDVPGPVTVAVALERTVEDRPQRVVVVGSGHFLSNTFLGSGGNLDLGMNIVNWLAGDDALIALQPRPTLDATLDFSRTALYSIALVFLIGVPLALALTGATVWWRRRRHRA
jgi:ABC-type uncharacterized transport system involved in gliding motility auxiliary subunit